MEITRTIDSAVRVLVHRAESGGVEVSCEYDEDLPFLNGKERGVKQILLNLLTNAVKFTPRGGAVTVSAVENQGLDIVVTDNGVGIAEEDQQRVFTLSSNSMRAACSATRARVWVWRWSNRLRRCMTRPSPWTARRERAQPSPFISRKRPWCPDPIQTESLRYSRLRGNCRLVARRTA